MSSVRVVARIRPLLKHELGKDIVVSAESPTDDEPTKSIIRVPNPKNDIESYSFQFSSVYEESVSQSDLFEAEGEVPLVSL